MIARAVQADIYAGHIAPDKLVDVLDAAADALSRPLWIYTPAQDDETSVYVVDGTGTPRIPSDTPPIRLGHAGAMVFAPIFLEDDPVPAPVPQLSVEDEIIPSKQVIIPRLAPSLPRSLAPSLLSTPTRGI